VLLCLPFSQAVPVSVIDNLFIATSALSTTGLVTVSVSDSYTFFGELVILALIQIGGIGYMTLSSFIVMASTSHLSSTRSSLLQKEFSLPEDFSIRSFIISIIRFTFIIEISGALLLWLIFLKAGKSHALWSAVFHSISSFCTAGFGLYNDSFESLKFNLPLNIVVMLLSYLGAIGFIVLHDVERRMLKGKAITFTSKIIIAVTILLSVFGTMLIYFFEPSVQAFNVQEKVITSLFQAMTAITTVGFNTIPIGNLSQGILMVIVFLMYVGASPSGTGGGLKSTTLTAIIGFVVSVMKGREKVILFGREIPPARVRVAISIMIIYTTLLFLGSALLAFTEKTAYMNILFEAASALGTVGLSTGITAALSFSGKIIIIFLMFIGRVGIITFGTVLVLNKVTKFRENIMQADLAV
jgi:trk system potassium uptake protein TrkH